MRIILQQLCESLASGRDAAWCRVLETRGSTPQKPGAAMVVFPDGSQAGTLGGGSVEAEVTRRALRSLASGTAEIAAFQLDDDLGWDDTPICGGSMRILIQPLAAGPVPVYYQELKRRIEERSAVTEAIVWDAAASGLELLASYLLDADGQLVATWHVSPEHGELPPQVREHFKPLPSRPLPYAARGIAYLPVAPRALLLVVGGGHIGQAVARLAADLDFDVWVVDDRAEYVTRERFPRAERRIAGALRQVLPEVPVNPETYCLIVTRGHRHDAEALALLADRGARYVGMIGSRRKVQMVFEDLLRRGVSPEALARVHAPVGIDIGSQTVPEIAVSICAELVSHRNRGGVVPGRSDRPQS
mgnify:CR=1 FL=1